MGKTRLARPLGQIRLHTEQIPKEETFLTTVSSSSCEPVKLLNSSSVRKGWAALTKAFVVPWFLPPWRCKSLSKLTAQLTTYWMLTR